MGPGCRPSGRCCWGEVTRRVSDRPRLDQRRAHTTAGPHVGPAPGTAQARRSLGVAQEWRGGGLAHKVGYRLNPPSMGPHRTRFPAPLHLAWVAAPLLPARRGVQQRDTGGPRRQRRRGGRRHALRGRGGQRVRGGPEAVQRHLRRRGTGQRLRHGARVRCVHPARGRQRGHRLGATPRSPAPARRVPGRQQGLRRQLRGHGAGERLQRAGLRSVHAAERGAGGPAARSSGGCDYTACIYGFEDLDGNRANGCEAAFCPLFDKRCPSLACHRPDDPSVGCSDPGCRPCDSTNGVARCAPGAQMFEYH